MAEWLRSGLQNRVHRFNSGRHLQQLPQLEFSPDGGIGIRGRLKICSLYRVMGPSPIPGTIQKMSVGIFVSF